MQKLVERLTEKYLLKDIRRITLQVYHSNFDRVFNECCESREENNTTIGCAFDIIERNALYDVNRFMDGKIKSITFTLNTLTGNPFDLFIDSMWDVANEYLSFKEYVLSILDEERGEKEAELWRLGIINIDGDYMKPETLAEKLNA